MVLERKKLLPYETLVDLGDEVITESLIKKILGHEFFAPMNIYPEVKQKIFKCKFQSEPVEIATGINPEVEGEYYVVVAEVVEEERSLTKRKLVLMGSSEQLRQLKVEGRMHEYSLLMEELKRKKETLALKLFDNIG